MAGARYSSRFTGARRALSAVVGALLCYGLLATSAFAETLIPYEVQAGDTIWDLAGQFGTTVDDITSSNSLSDPNNLAIGQFLLIKSPAQTIPATSESASPDTSSLVQLPSNLVFRDGDVTTIGAGSLLVAPRWAPRQLAALAGLSPSV